MNLNNIGITWFRTYFIEKANMRIKRVMRLWDIGNISNNLLWLEHGY